MALERDIHASVSEQIKKNFYKAKWKVMYIENVSNKNIDLVHEHASYTFIKKEVLRLGLKGVRANRKNCSSILCLRYGLFSGLDPEFISVTSAGQTVRTT